MTPKTYCNPLPLPNYQRGKASAFKDVVDEGWIYPHKPDFREMADPTVIKFKDRWYLFPSAGMLWVSDDMVNWEFRPIEPFDPGYAPTVIQNGEYLYLTACDAGMWRAKDPMGPWEDLGPIKDQNGETFLWRDPMLFTDDDGKMYGYFGSSKEGVYAVQMRPDDPTRFVDEPVHCFEFNPDHIWERFGEFNQDPDQSWPEGAWMTKHNGRYYLQYSAPGTEWKNYAVGVYVGDSPLGPFEYQKRNPILLEKGGLVNGCGHHSMVDGPNGTLWCFYTTLVRIHYKFERRIGMDPVGFTESGEMFVNGPSEMPQLAPGLIEDPSKNNDAGWLPLSVNQPVRASSYLEGREPMAAVDNCIRTWWEADGTGPHWLEIDLGRFYRVHAARTLFGDRGLDYDEGVIPAPYHYFIEGSADGQSWKVLCDRSQSKEEKHIAYDECDSEQSVRWVRLRVIEVPRGMRLAVWQFTVFGVPA